MSNVDKFRQKSAEAAWWRGAVKFLGRVVRRGDPDERRRAYILVLRSAKLAKASPSTPPSPQR